MFRLILNVFALTLLTSCYPFMMGSSVGMCQYSTISDKPIQYKGLTFPAGTTWEYVSYTNGGDCKIWYKDLSEVAKEPENLEVIVLPKQAPLIWGGMPIERIDLSPAYGADWTLLPSTEPHPAEQQSAFAQQWRQCGDDLHLNIRLKDNNWQFKQQDAKNIDECGIQRGNNQAQQAFLDQLAAKMKAEQQKSSQ